jgi:ZIP family zinc transporter
MLEALGLGTLAQSSLLIAGLLVCWVTIPRRLVGILAGFGAGALIAAVSFDLLAEADELTSAELALWMLVGVAIFLGGDKLVERRFGNEGVGGAMGIVVGSVVDGVPESIIFGIQIATDFPVSISFLAAVFVSNIPQAIAPSADLAASGWSPRRLGMLWLLVVGACGIAAALGFLMADATSAATGDRVAALAAGGILAMLTNSLMPFAYDRGGSLAGAATVVGFCVSLIGT